MATLVLIVLAILIVMTPKALGTWLSARDETRAGHDESQVQRAAGGAE